jgi:TRAP-type C4-dicarboxylate transport system permease small subunit
VTGIFATIAGASLFYPLLTALVALGLLLRAILRRRWGSARWSARVGQLERLALSSLLLTMLGLAGLQILLRNLFHTGLIWIDPLLRHLVLWIGFTAAVVAAGRLRHIQLDVIGRLLPERARIAVLRLTSAAAAIICAVLARAAWVYLGQEQEFGSTGLLGIPVWILSCVIFLGLAFMSLRFSARALDRSTDLAVVLKRREGGVADG